MYISQDVADRIKNLAQKKSISVKKLLSDIGLGFNTMSNMRNSMPKADNLAKIADYLGCSVDYLLGRTEEYSPQSTKQTTVEADKEYFELIEEYKKLDLKGKNKVLNTIFSEQERVKLLEPDESMQLAAFGCDFKGKPKSKKTQLT